MTPTFLTAWLWWERPVPKRRVRSAAQIASQRKASRAAAVKRARSTTNPIPQGKSWPDPIKGSFGHTRRHKLGGKAYHHKTASNFKVAQEAKDLLSGKTTFAQTEAKHASSGMGHNGRGLLDSPRGGGHKMAPPIPKSAVRKSAPKPRIEQHGSGTGLTSAHRYLPVNVAARRRAIKGKKVKGGHGYF